MNRDIPIGRLHISFGDHRPLTQFQYPSYHLIHRGISHTSQFLGYAIINAGPFRSRQVNNESPPPRFTFLRDHPEWGHLNPIHLRGLVDLPYSSLCHLLLEVVPNDFPVLGGLIHCATPPHQTRFPLITAQTKSLSDPTNQEFHPHFIRVLTQFLLPFLPLQRRDHFLRTGQYPAVGALGDPFQLQQLACETVPCKNNQHRIVLTHRTESPFLRPN